MALQLNALVDRTKQQFLQFLGDTGFRDDFLRSQTNFKDFLLTAAQVDTLNATAVTVLPAPGAGLINLIQGIFLGINSTGFTAFASTGGVLEFRYTDASGAKVVTDIAEAVVESATNLLSWSPGLVVAPLANALICAHTSADYTAGTGNIQGRIFYRTVKLAEIVP